LPGSAAGPNGTTGRVAAKRGAHRRPADASLALGLAAWLACGCAATTDDRRAANTVTIALKATSRNAGQVGSALLGGEGDRTPMVLTISGVPPWVSRPVQLLTFVYAGTCAEPAATPAYALNAIVQAQFAGNGRPAGPFTMEKTVPLPLAALRAASYAIVVRTTPADGNVDIFCGEIR
jgi:hypothetical protein